jgi:hypothetical protein
MFLPAGVATLRGTLPWIAPEIIKTPGAVTEAVVSEQIGTLCLPGNTLICLCVFRQTLPQADYALLQLNTHLHLAVADMGLWCR